MALPEKHQPPLELVVRQTEEERDRAGFESTWRELVVVKARCAELMNEVAVLRRAFEDLKTDTRRHIKRVDAIASRLTAPTKP